MSASLTRCRVDIAGAEALNRCSLLSDAEEAPSKPDDGHCDYDIALTLRAKDLLYSRAMEAQRAAEPSPFQFKGAAAIRSPGRRPACICKAEFDASNDR